MTGPKGNSGFCCLEILNVPRGEAEVNVEGGGETKLTVPVWPVITCFCYTSQLKNRTNHKNFHKFAQNVHKFVTVSRCTTWSRVSRKFKLLFRWGVSEFWPRALNDSPLIGKRIWVGRYNKLIYHERGTKKQLLLQNTFILFLCLFVCCFYTTNTLSWSWTLVNWRPNLEYFMQNFPQEKDCCRKREHGMNWLKCLIEGRKHR